MRFSLDNATILVTGGTGSLGQTLIRRLLQEDRGKPAKIIVFSRCEAKQYAMKTMWKHLQAATDDVYYHNFDDLIQFRIGDVRDPVRVREAVRQADVVVHAAAMKQVPTCEYFPTEAVATNVSGTANIIRAARDSKSTRVVVAISTDKACKPINVMGMTKAIAERIVAEGNLCHDDCRFTAVRYGNVLSSRGSVIPLFTQQIAAGGPVTITLPEMTRFLLSLNSACDTVFAAIDGGQRGEVFVPKVASARVVDIAAHLIGDRSIRTEFIGIRPGEKIHEILISEEESFRTTERNNHYVIGSHLPELTTKSDSRALTAEYSSANAVVTGDALRQLLAQADFVDPAMSSSAEIVARQLIKN